MAPCANCNVEVEDLDAHVAEAHAEAAAPAEAPAEAPAPAPEGGDAPAA